ncbi:MAG TPA: thioesterase family protein [Microvirga sp.]|jgi:acyl-CoA thioesterase FadM|nr:thioesterase family protein [Microvirga sp.]
MSAWQVYAHRRQIGWGDTDPARIAYTGRFADFMLEAIEGWYRDRLGTDWYRLNIDEGIGTPFVHLSLDFRSPVTPREAIDVEVRVARVGRTSLSFKIAAYGATSRTLCFEGEATSVFVDAATMKPRPIPDRYAERIAAEHRHASEG